MIAILQFTDDQRPGFLETYLKKRDHTFQLYRPDRDGVLPIVTECSALALLGGTMEVNDPLPWIAPVLSLIRQADQHGVPVIGHCLGGQLIACAFGADVNDNKCFEIGWHNVEVLASDQKNKCFSGLDSFIPFHWHYQTFSLPRGAELLLRNQNCAHQAFQLRRNLAFQCHIEMTAELVECWCHSEEAQLKRLDGVISVQSEKKMLEDVKHKVIALQQVTERIYDYWLALSGAHKEYINTDFIGT